MIKKQKGMALLTSIVFLLMLTLLAVSSVKSIMLQDKMVGATFDRGISFNAAEAALVVAEQRIESEAAASNSGFISQGLYLDETPGVCPSTPVCQNGLCNVPDVDCHTMIWEISSPPWFNVIGLGLPANYGNPKYIIEYLGTNFPCDNNNPSGAVNCARYRTTVVVDRGTENSFVMLQSIYSTELKSDTLGGTEN